MTSLLIVMKKNHISQCYHYIHTYIHKLYLNTNLSVAKKAETKVKLSDKSPNSHEKKNTYLNVTMTCTHAYINFI